MGLLNLANELLFGVAENLDIADLNSFLQTSRRLATLLTPNFRKLSTSESNATAALLCAAAVRTDEDLVRLLLENGEGITVLNGAGLRARSIHTSPGKCSDDVMDFVLSQGPDLVLKDGIALHWAASKGRAVLVELLLGNGADITALDTGHSTALHHACIGPEQNDKVISLLLDKKADIAAEDMFGNSALVWAVRKNNHAATKLLIARGASINFHNTEGKTPLHIAASLEDGTIIRLLLDNGAHVDSKDCGGMTALHVAASCGHEMAVRLLLENGADINAQDGRKWSPLHLAALGGEIITAYLLALAPGERS